jgi:hypothetical protein
VAAYLRSLTMPRFVLWCYLIWYLLTVATYFEPSPRLWLTSLGISAIIGSGLYLSTARAGAVPVELGRWSVFRLFLMPFCVSSFAALIRGHDFILVFHPSAFKNLLGFGLCAAFGAIVWALKLTPPRSAVGDWRAARASRSTTPSTVPARSPTAH